MMTALLLVTLASSFQDPVPDEVAAKFPDPVPADRTWEMAATYYGRIGDALVREDYDGAREWERRARERLPNPYRSHLWEIGHQLWPYLSSGTRESDLHRARESLGRAFGVKVAPPPAGADPDGRLLCLSQTAWLFAFRGEHEAASECLTAMERMNPRSQWIKDIDANRKDMEALKAAGDQPDALARLSWRVGFAGTASHLAAFAVLERLIESLATSARAAAFQAGAAYLRAIRDEAGARAWEDRQFGEKGVSDDDLANLVLNRANEAFKLGEYGVAEEGYRRILREWPACRSRGSAMYNLGFSLLSRKKYPEAREALEKLMGSDVNDKDQGDHIMEAYRNYRPKAIIHIGESYEAEGDWAKALEAYRDRGRKYPSRSWCGNCAASAGLQSQARIVRCLVHLDRLDEAMNICRKSILESGGDFSFGSAELNILAVDIAVRLGRADDFERELEAKFSGVGSNWHACSAPNYLRILRMRAAGDHAGLFDVLRLGALRWHQNRWEEMRNRHRIAVEAAECLGELGDPAFEWLCEKVRSKLADADLALIAIAHFKTPRALEFIRAIHLKPHTNDASLRRMLVDIHSGPSRKRRYPPPTPQIQKQAMVPGMPELGVVLGVLVVGLAALVRCRKLRGLKLGA